jgi:hypothetical protein
MMKARKLFLGVAAVAAATAGLLVACNKNIDRKGSDRALTAGVLATCDCPAASTTDTTLSGIYTTDYHMSNSKRYNLNGFVFFTNGAKLTIDSGTTIRGIKGSPGGGLVITRGSQIIANGTPSCPIVFTSNQAAGSQASGDWAGVIILGNAQTNNSPATVEGINSASFPGVDLTYGSTTTTSNTESSGSLKYVRIEYAGYALSTDNEVNGLTLAGVGSGTTIDYVEVYKSNDDAFEFFGGTVNASHLLAVDALDDMFDTDNGYTGTIRFALGLADTSRKDQSQSNGFESDNNSGGTVPAGLPVTEPHYHYVTIVGVPDSARAHRTVTSGSQTLRYGRAGHFRRNSRFHIDSSIVFGYSYGISIDSQLLNSTSNSLVEWNAGRSSLFKVFAAGYGAFFTNSASIGGFAKESNGNAPTGSGFALSSFILTPQNFGQYTPTNGNPYGLTSPYSRPAFASNAPITNWVTNALLATDSLKIYGAFPNKTDWTKSTTCTNNWTRFKD